MEDEEDPEKANKEKIKDFKEQIMNILNRLNCGMQRTSKLGIDDFLKLLVEFNSEGIHFR